eukprot:scaffold665876_cov130-Attheya_sp.AAC.1
MRRVVSVPSARLSELTTLTHIGQKLSNHFYWECWNCGPTKFKTIHQKKSRLRPSIPPPVVPNSANEPNNKKDPLANEPNHKKDPPPPPESEKNKMNKSTATVPNKDPRSSPTGEEQYEEVHPHCP